VTWFELIDTHCIVSLAGKVVEGRTSHGSQAEHQAITVFHRGLLCEELLTRRLLSAASINSTRWRCAVVDTCPHIAARVFRSGQFASSDHLNQAVGFCFVTSRQDNQTTRYRQGASHCDAGWSKVFSGSLQRGV
jgi:hypothetical protein